MLISSYADFASLMRAVGGPTALDLVKAGSNTLQSLLEVILNSQKVEYFVCSSNYYYSYALGSLFPVLFDAVTRLRTCFARAPVCFAWSGAIGGPHERGCDCDSGGISGESSAR